MNRDTGRAHKVQKATSARDMAWPAGSRPDDSSDADMSLGGCQFRGQQQSGNSKAGLLDSHFLLPELAFRPNITVCAASPRESSIDCLSVKLKCRKEFALMRPIQLTGRMSINVMKSLPLLVVLALLRLLGFKITEREAQA
jgi:hypothetical protein